MTKRQSNYRRKRGGEDARRRGGNQTIEESEMTIKARRRDGNQTIEGGEMSIKAIIQGDNQTMQGETQGSEVEDLVLFDCLLATSPSRSLLLFDCNLASLTFQYVRKRDHETAIKKCKVT